MTTFPDDLNLADYFLYQRLASGDGDRKAILFGERVYSYNDIAKHTRGLRAYFQALGLRREERVLVVLPDTPPFAWSLMATFAEGAVACMGNPNAPTEHIDYLIKYTRASVVITVPRVARGLVDAFVGNTDLRAVLLAPDVATGDDPTGPTEMPTLGDINFEVHALADVIEHGLGLAKPVSVQTHRDDVCMWLFTSGSTGRPKAAMHTHRDFAFNTEVYAKNTLKINRDDITLSVPRLFFGYATGTNLFFPMALGAATGLFSERATPETLAEMIAAYRPTIVTNVPTMMGKLLAYDEECAQRDKPGLDFSSLRFQLSAGEALPPALLERFSKRFGGEIYDGIGSAEMFHIYCSNRPGGVFPGSLGQVVEGYELKVLARDAMGPGSPELPAGEVGVLWIKGDSVALGYAQDRDKSWKTFFGQWCRSGDLFRKDEKGCYWFCGRDDDLFKVSGIWVSPIEVENCLMTHGEVAHAAVIPLSFEGLVKPVAYVALRDPAKEHESLANTLKEYCKNVLSKHKYPRDIHFVSELPKNDRGKVDRKRLMKEASQ